MLVYTADETGLAKCTKTVGGSHSLMQKLRKQDREHAVVSMCFAPDLSDSEAVSDAAQTEDHQASTLLGVCDGTLELWRDGAVTQLISEACTGNEQKFTGLEQRDGLIWTCGDDGIVRTWDTETLEKQNEHKAHAHVARLRLAPSRGIFGVGGKDCDLRVWDIERTDKPVFKAKNVPHNRVNLAVPVFIKDMAFVDDHTIVTGSAHRHLRLYDTRVKARPLYSVVLDDSPITALALLHDAKHVVVANTMGKVSLVDLRSGERVGGFKGAAGSVRSLSVHPTEKYLATAGLDRFVRIYDTSSRGLVSKIYLKQRLNAVLLGGDTGEMAAGEDTATAGANDKDIPVGSRRSTSLKGTEDPLDDEDDWAVLETVGDSSKRAKVATLSAEHPVAARRDEGEDDDENDGESDDVEGKDDRRQASKPSNPQKSKSRAAPGKGPAPKRAKKTKSRK